MRGLTVAAGPEEAAGAAADHLAEAVREARRHRGRAHLALAGGSTPRRTYEVLAQRLDDWSGVEVWFSDERAVPPEDPESNYRLAAETLLARAPIPPERVHRVLGERGAEEAARVYEAELSEYLPAGDRAFPALDVALLGIGEDGHTASLFPGSPALEDGASLCLAVRAPKPPPARVTLTLAALRATRRIVFLATGAEKAPAVRAVLARPSLEVPASLLAGDAADLIVDADADPGREP